MKGLRFQYGPGLELCRTWWGLPEDIIALHLAWSAMAQRLDATIEGLLASARRQMIALTPDHVLRARAYDLIECVSLEFEHIHRGQMRELHQAFMAERQRRPSLQYDEFARRFKIRLLYAVVSALNA